MADNALRDRLRQLRSNNLPQPQPQSHPQPKSSSTSTKPTATATASSTQVEQQLEQISTPSLFPPPPATELASKTNQDQLLFDRLKALNPSSAAIPEAVASGPRQDLFSPVTVYAPSAPKKLDEQEEIDQLIRQTSELVQLQRELYRDSSSPPSPNLGADSDDDQESIAALESEANEILQMAKDQLALERKMRTIPSVAPDSDDEREEQAMSSSEQPAPSTPGVVIHADDLDLANELADAAQDTDYSAAAQSMAGSKPRRGGSRWSPRTTLFLVASLVIFFSVCAVPGAYAFGAGNIPSFAYMEGKAFRHGDIEDVLAELVKKSGGFFGSGGKFGGLDIKRIYFGNWLRDYSQAMDVAALSKMTKQAILNIVMVLGFLAHGYATAEFEVTSERLGVYLPEEHLDNPKGYADGKDARQYDSRLRGPVDPRELEIDPRSGMKNYLANESGGWPTGSALIRNTLKRVIDLGRRARQSGSSEDLFETYRLLGQALHTLEDLPAHSNWCELALHKLGHHQVFLHVGDNVKVTAPDGTRIAPLVTGTFGSADFMHSMLGEAQDHLSEASISDLNKAMDKAKAQSSGNNRSPIQDILGMLSKIPGGGSTGGGNISRDLEEVSRGPQTNPADMSPQELYKNMWKILELRDRIVKSIEQTIERIPGLSSLVEKITNELNVFVFTLIEPYAKPIMQQGMNALHLGSGAVINKEDQFEVFNDPNASDPTHSILSKDHFGLILNEVAGNVAKIIVRHTVTLIVKAWDDNSIDAERTADECLAPMFHPYWFSGRSQVQREMLDYIANWASSHRAEIGRLDREHVRSHTNTRSGKAEPHSHGNSNSQQGGGSSFGSQMAGSASNFISGQVHSFANQHLPRPPAGLFRDMGGDGTGNPEQGGGYPSQSSYGHERPQGSYGDAPAPSHSHGESSSYYGGGGGGGGGGGSGGMPDSNQYAPQYGGQPPAAQGYPEPQPQHQQAFYPPPGSAFGPPGGGGGYPQEGYGPPGGGYQQEGYGPPGGYGAPGGFAPPPPGPPGGYGQGGGYGGYPQQGGGYGGGY